MANENQSITVRISAVIDDFKKKMQDVRKSLDHAADQVQDFGDDVKGTQEQIQDIGKTLDQAADQVEGFGDEIKETAEEIQTIDQSLDQAADQMQGFGDETKGTAAEIQDIDQSLDNAADQVQDFGDEIKGTAGEIQAIDKSMDKAADQVQDLGNKTKSADQKIKDIGKSVNNSSKKVKEFGDSVKGTADELAGLSATSAVFGGAAIKAASDFDAAQGRLQAQLGLTAKQTERLTDVAKTLFLEGFGENMTDSADAVAKVYRNMGNLETDELKKVTRAAHVLSLVFEADVAESTRAAAQLMQQFGVSGEDAMDMITKAFQSGANFSDELLDTITEYSTQFANMGFSAEQMMGLFVKGVDSGIFSLDKMADATKESFLQITDGADNTRKAVESLGIDYDTLTKDITSGGEDAQAAFIAVMTALNGIEDSAERNALAIELMGTPLEDLGPQYQEFFADIDQEMTDFEGASEDAAAAVQDNFGFKIIATFRRVGEAIAPLGDVLIGMFERLMPHIESFSAKVSAWFTALSPQTQTIIAGFVLFAAVLAPVLLVLGGIIASISMLISVFAPLFSIIGTALGWLGRLWSMLAKVRNIFKIVRIVMLALTGPIGWVILAVTALVGIGIWLWENWEAISKWLTATWNWIKNKAANLFGDTAQAISDKMEQAKEWINEKIEDIRGFFEDFDLLQTGKDIIQGLIDGFTGMVGEVGSAIGNIGSAIMDGITGFFGISSPSKLMRDEVGKPITEGILRGMLDKESAVNRAVNSLSNSLLFNPQDLNLTPSVAAEAFYGFGASSIDTLGGSDTVGPFGANNGVIVLDVPLIVDGREIARATAPFTEEEIERLRTTRQRAKGVIRR